MNNLSYHVPVLCTEAILALNINPKGRYIDLTFGGGGYSRAILEKLDADGKVLAFDKDVNAHHNLLNDERLLLIPSDFRYMLQFARYFNFMNADGIVADLGVSSHQFDTAQRGFSYKMNAPLDMRMNQNQTLTAAKVVNELSAQYLQQIFSKFGEIKNAKTLAEVIANQRNIGKITTTTQLAEIVIQYANHGGDAPHKYLAKVFQAIRIYVNSELDSLEVVLEDAPKVLKNGGILVVASYHSLEDRLVKDAFNKIVKDNSKEALIYGKKQKIWDTITNKAILPSDEELNINPRSRSAKLRAAIKL
jgi:16S rRNA (cytosine1402-N4)-methyltransferase